MHDAVHSKGKEQEREAESESGGRHSVSRNHSNGIVTDDVRSLQCLDVVTPNNTVASMSHPVSGGQQLCHHGKPSSMILNFIECPKTGSRRGSPVKQAPDSVLRLYQRSIRRSANNAAVFTQSKTVRMQSRTPRSRKRLPTQDTPT